MIFVFFRVKQFNMRRRFSFKKSNNKRFHVNYRKNYINRLRKIKGNLYKTSVFGQLSYEYQIKTLLNGYLTRYLKIWSFFRIPRLQFAFLRFSEVTTAIEHMIYFSSRLRLLSFSRVFFYWNAPIRSKSRRWKRKFWTSDPVLRCHAMFTPDQFFNFWQTFMVMYMSHLTYKGFFKKTGTGTSLLHWFKRINMYWEYPTLWSFFSSNLAVHYELMNVLLKIQLTTKNRRYLMMDRDFFRMLNFPIILYSLPRLWQPDPAKFVVILRNNENLLHTV